MRNRWTYLFGLLLLGVIAIWLAVLSIKPKYLRLIACDVGQGDAILAVYGETEVLIDGGPNEKVLDCLARYLPFWDKEIELIVLTHPQLDHYGGLIDVFKNYKVGLFLANSLDSSSQRYQLLKTLVGGSEARVVDPHRGQSIRLGMIHLDIFHPSEEFITQNSDQVASRPSSTFSGPRVPEKSASMVESPLPDASVLGTRTSRRDPNEFSIIGKLSFGDFDALLTGDASPEINEMVAGNNAVREVEYIKVPHHGSRNGLTEKLLDKVNPEVAVISVGKSNSYGHPHEEILKTLSERDIKILRTDKMGDILIATDGKSWWEE